VTAAYHITLDDLTRAHARERIASQVQRGESCTLWTGSTMNKGYGRISVLNHKLLVHRVAWVLVHGPIPDGYMVDHICGNRKCVTPDHLRLVTPKQNGEHRTRQMSNNTSGYPGVTWSAFHGQWQAGAGHNGSTCYLGRFETAEAAYLAYVRFAIDNFSHADDKLLTLTPAAQALVSTQRLADRERWALDDELEAKAIARAAEWDDPTDCD
jgi:hypothetical protein